LANKYLENKEKKTRTRSIDKIFLHSFLLNLVQTYWFPNPVSYVDPKMEYISYHEENLARKERFFLIDREFKQEKPEICVPKSFYFGKSLTEALLKKGLNLTKPETKHDYPLVINELKSKLNGRLIKTEEDLAFNVVKFNAITRIKTQMHRID
jgi:hypothetical protein